MGVPVSAGWTGIDAAAGSRAGRKHRRRLKALDRVGPDRGGPITLAELVEEHLELHEAEPVTIAKLLWQLGKATSTLGEKRVAELSLARSR